MSADDIVLSANSVDTLARQQAASRDEWPRGFWIGLACAAAVHAVLIVGVARNAPRYLGDAGGAPDAINVELVDEADLRSRETGAAQSAPPAAPAPPPQPQAAQAPESAPETPQPETKQPADQAPPQREPDKPAEAAAAEQPASVLPLEKEKPQASPPQDERAKESAQQKEAEAAPKMELKPPEQLDLSLPFNMTMRDAPYEEVGRSSALNRPPGITRSGENDEFGRGVIRALRKTMPPATGTKGRVTIKFILDERGNIATIKLVQGAGIRDLDDGVLFSAQQASFPFPPKGATVADRTFLITYVYK